MLGPDGNDLGPDAETCNPDRDTVLPPAPGAQAGQNGTERVAARPKAGTHQEHNADGAGPVLDPDLVDLVQRWDEVPAPVRAAILSIVRSYF